jgi:hypothetical protein
MQGQWIGTYTGTSKGDIMVNVDARESFFQGTAYLVEDDPVGFIPMATFKTADKNPNFKFRTDSINPINDLGLVLDWEEIKKKFPGHSFSRFADATGSWDADSLTLKWTTDIGATGTCTLPRSKSSQPSELVAVNKDWGFYKEHVTNLGMKRALFRGQPGIWKLQTSFHRRGRSDLARFIGEDIPILYRHLSARTRHVFNLSDPDQNGAFINLVRHHGYPSPLLDWSYSPFVPAFFAYHKITKKEAAEAGPDDKVRVLVFDREQWCADCRQILFVAPPRPHVSFCEFIAIENERMIPQQAVSTVTNVDDIEEYLKQVETVAKKTYLTAIDLPKRDRHRVIRELSYMGITAGALFPGLDGACDELAERNF